MPTDSHSCTRSRTHAHAEHMSVLALIRARTPTHKRERVPTQVVFASRVRCQRLLIGPCRKTPRDVATHPDAFDAAAKAAAAMRFKVGDEVVDHDGERCRVADVDPANGDKPYELEYPDGSRYWAAASALRAHAAKEL
jgi:hypothetical protein